MKMKTVIVLAFAVGCGLIAMMGVQQMIAQRSAGTEEQTVRVLVASMDISPGVLINEKNTEFKDYPIDLVPGDAIQSKEEYANRGLMVPVTAGDIIRQSKLGGRGEIAASASIPEGMRAVSIQVNDTKTHSGLLQPGDRIDLQISYDVRNRDGALITKTATLLEYIEVFAADSIRNLEAGESKEIKAKNITLLATRRQAELIQLADTQGDILPILRSKEDDVLTVTQEEQKRLVDELTTGTLQNLESFEEPTEEVAKNQSKKSDMSAAEAFKKFLNSEVAEPPKQQQVVQQPAEPEPEVKEEMWIIQVYAGDEVMEQEVALPVAMAQETGEQQANTQPGGIFSGATWKGLLNSVLQPAEPQPTKRPVKTKPQTKKTPKEPAQNELKNTKKPQPPLPPELESAVPVEM